MKNLLKLTVAGGIVFGIWFALLVLFPKPDLSAPQVAEAEADIITFDFAAKGDQEKFVEVLEEQGLEKPRVYDWNGNTMFFSTTTTSESPRQVMRRFQEEFYRKGVNKRVHLVPARRAMPDFLTSVKGLKSIHDISEKRLSKDELKFLVTKKDEAIESREILDDFFGGGMLPTSVSNNSVAMVGMTSKQEARTGEQFVKEVGDQIRANKKAGKKGDIGPTLAKSVKSMRFLEAFKTNRGETRITATWSDENLDLRKIENKGDEGLSVDPGLPGCVGCERLTAFKGRSEGEREFGATVYKANQQSIKQVVTFYTRSLMNRGWMPSESSQAMLDAKVAGLMPDDGSEIINFANKDGKFLTLLVHKDKDGETRAHLVQSD